MQLCGSLNIPWYCLSLGLEWKPTYSVTSGKDNWTGSLPDSFQIPAPRFQPQSEYLALLCLGGYFIGLLKRCHHLAKKHSVAWWNLCRQPVNLWLETHSDHPRYASTLGAKHFCCCCSVTKLCPILCDPMDCSIPDFPVPHCLLRFVQTHVHWVGDAIQPSHLLLPPYPPALNLSQPQGLFQWIRSWIGLSRFMFL